MRLTLVKVLVCLSLCASACDTASTQSSADVFAEVDVPVGSVGSDAGRGAADAAAALSEDVAESPGLDVDSGADVSAGPGDDVAVVGAAEDVVAAEDAAEDTAAVDDAAVDDAAVDDAAVDDAAMDDAAVPPVEVVPDHCDSNDDCPSAWFCCQPPGDTCDQAMTAQCVQVDCPPEGLLQDVTERGDGWLEVRLLPTPYTCQGLPWPEAWSVYVAPDGQELDEDAWSLHATVEVQKPTAGMNAWGEGHLAILEGLDNDIVHAVAACPVFEGVEYGACTSNPLHAMPAVAEAYEASLGVPGLSAAVRPAVMGYPWGHVIAVQAEDGVHLIEGLPGAAVDELAIPGGKYPQGISAGLMQIAYLQETQAGYGVFVLGYSGQPAGEPAEWVTLDETDWWEAHHLAAAEFGGQIAFQYGGELLVGKPGALTSLGFKRHHPWLTADGGTLLYRTKDGIFSATPPTGEAELLFDGPAGEGMPELSEDGAHVLYTSDQSGHWELWVQSVETGARRQLTGGEVHHVHAATFSDDHVLAIGLVGDDPAPRLIMLAPTLP